MTTPTDPREIEQLKHSVKQVAEAMQNATELLRWLAPAREKLRDLQYAAEQWPIEPSAEPRALVKAAESFALRSDSTREQLLTLTVARIDDPLDQSRLHAALTAVPGVLDVVVRRLDSSRLTATLATTRPPRELPLLDALSATFPDMVRGAWPSEGELVVLIGSPGSHGGSWSPYTANDGVAGDVAPGPTRTRRNDRQSPSYDPATTREPEGSVPAADAYMSQVALSNPDAASGRAVGNRPRRWQLWRRSSPRTVS